jgi:hypothetical protein
MYNLCRSIFVAIVVAWILLVAATVFGVVSIPPEE